MRAIIVSDGFAWEDNWATSIEPWLTSGLASESTFKFIIMFQHIFYLIHDIISFQDVFYLAPYLGRVSFHLLVCHDSLEYPIDCLTLLFNSLMWTPNRCSHLRKLGLASLSVLDHYSGLFFVYHGPLDCLALQKDRTWPPKNPAYAKEGHFTRLKSIKKWKNWRLIKAQSPLSFHKRDDD